MSFDCNNLQTDGEGVDGVHSPGHAPKFDEFLVEVAESDLRRQVRLDPTKSANHHHEKVRDLLDGDVVKLFPKFESVKNSVYNAKNKEQPVNPESVEHLLDLFAAGSTKAAHKDPKLARGDIDRFFYAKNGERFLQYMDDSGLVIFARKSGFRRLAKA